MKILPILIVLVGLMLYQTDPSVCFLPISNGIKELRHSLVASFRSPLDRGLNKLRLYYFKKYSRKALLRTTITVSSTSTSYVSTALYCARFQNNGVTGACRRKKQVQQHDDMVQFNEVQPTQVLNRYILYYKRLL